MKKLELIGKIRECQLAVTAALPQANARLVISLDTPAWGTVQMLLPSDQAQQFKPGEPVSIVIKNQSEG